MRKAAERLYVSQPALSQRLRSLEKEWGTDIFLRSQKGLTLTPAGEKIIGYINDMLQREEALKDEIGSLRSEVHGTLKLAVASIIGQYWLPKVLKQYVEQYPHVKISLMTGWSSEILKQMYDDHIHLGIIRGNPDWKGIKQYVMSDELYLVDNTIESIDELSTTTKPFIQFKSDSTYFQDIQDWWQSRFQTSPERTIVVDQIETCKQMALNGIGYAILPSVSLTEHDRSMNRIPLWDDDRPLQRDTWLLTNESLSHLKQVRAFMDLVKEYKQKEH